MTDERKIDDKDLTEVSGGTGLTDVDGTGQPGGGDGPTLGERDTGGGGGAADQPDDQAPGGGIQHLDD
jgi:hypothetical protein